MSDDLNVLQEIGKVLDEIARELANELRRVAIAAVKAEVDKWDDGFVPSFASRETVREIRSRLAALRSEEEGGGVPAHVYVVTANDDERVAEQKVFASRQDAQREYERLVDLYGGSAVCLASRYVRAALRSEAPAGEGGVHPDPETWRCRQCGGYAAHDRDCPALRSEAPAGEPDAWLVEAQDVLGWWLPDEVYLHERDARAHDEQCVNTRIVPLYRLSARQEGGE